MNDKLKRAALQKGQPGTGSADVPMHAASEHAAPEVFSFDRPAGKKRPFLALILSISAAAVAALCYLLAQDFGPTSSPVPGGSGLVDDRNWDTRWLGGSAMACGVAIISVTAFLNPRVRKEPTAISNPDVATPEPEQFSDLGLNLGRGLPENGFRK